MMGFKFLTTTATAVLLGMMLFLFAPMPLNAVSAKENIADAPPESLEERRLLHLLSQERSRLESEYQDRAHKLDLREIELKTLAGTVDKKLTELQKLVKSLQLLMTEKTSVEAKRIKKLSKIYAKMKPAQAALLLTDLKKELAVAILGSMAPKSGAKILDNLSVGTANSLSVAYSSLDSR